MAILKKCEKSLKKYFRYLPVKLSGDVGNSQVHSIAEKSHKMLSKAIKTSKLRAMWQWEKVQTILWKIIS